jgi:naphthalene 1,2-dioxygenase system ferredoxin subunit
MSAGTGGELLDWVEAALEADIPADEGHFVEVDGRKIALFRVEGQIYAIDDTCPHTGAGQLSLGFLDEGVVECPMHQACFDVRTGKVLAGPATEDVRSYPVKAEGGAVFLQLGDG